MSDNRVISTKFICCDEGIGIVFYKNSKMIKHLKMQLLPHGPPSEFRRFSASRQTLLMTILTLLEQIYTQLKFSINILISGFGLPSEIRTTPKNPHCMQITWKKPAGHVTGYRVYCFPDNSQEAEIMKDIDGGNTESAFISGLKPETSYRVGVTSVSSRTQSKQVFCDHQLSMRKIILQHRKLEITLFGY